MNLSELQTSNRVFTAQLKTNQPGKENELMAKAATPVAPGKTLQGQVAYFLSIVETLVLSAPCAPRPTLFSGFSNQPPARHNRGHR